MNDELDKKLCEKYPLIFAKRHDDMRETAMCWGFECGDGWYGIIDALCSNIQSHVNQSNKGAVWSREWNEMIDGVLAGDLTLFEKRHHGYGEEHKAQTLDDIRSGVIKKVEAKKHLPQVTAEQVKEKFGTLRFYTNLGDDYIYGLVAMAESMSARVCERCGKPGKLFTSGWFYTACDDHARPEDLLVDTTDAEKNKS